MQLYSRSGKSSRPRGREGDTRQRRPFTGRAGLETGPRHGAPLATHPPPAAGSLFSRGLLQPSGRPAPIGEDRRVAAAAAASPLPIARPRPAGEHAGTWRRRKQAPTLGPTLPSFSLRPTLALRAAARRPAPRMRRRRSAARARLRGGGGEGARPRARRAVAWAGARWLSAGARGPLAVRGFPCEGWSSGTRGSPHALLRCQVSRLPALGGDVIRTVPPAGVGFLSSQTYKVCVE